MARYQKVTVYLTPAQRRGLLGFHRITGAPVQRFVRLAVDRFLESFESRPKKKAAKRRGPRAARAKQVARR